MLGEAVQIDRSIADAAVRAWYALDRGDAIHGVHEIDRLHHTPAAIRSDAYLHRTPSIHPTDGGHEQVDGADTHGAAAIGRGSSRRFVFLHIARHRGPPRDARHRASVSAQGPRRPRARSSFRQTARARLSIGRARVAATGAPAARGAASADQTVAGAGGVPTGRTSPGCATTL